MADIKYNDYANSVTAKKNFADRPVIGYFKLNDDGDEAIVRFAYNTKADFKVVTTHRVKVNDAWRNISCLNTLETPDVCPLCKKQEKVLTKVFVNTVDYEKDESGKVVPVPKVWERPVQFVGEILEAMKDAIEDGDIPQDSNICDVVFKVKRVGAKGSRDTRYKLRVAKPAIFPETTYVKDFSAFEGFSAAYHSYMVKTAEEITSFLETGKFPQKEKPAEAKSAEVKEEVPPHPVDDDFGFTPDNVEQKAPITNQGIPPATNKPRRYTW